MTVNGVTVNTRRTHFQWRSIRPFRRRAITACTALGVSAPATTASILCEKPLALDAAECREMRAAPAPTARCSWKHLCTGSPRTEQRAGCVQHRQRLRYDANEGVIDALCRSARADGRPAAVEARQ